ncbi:hypothetical protein BZA77DRAFT_354016 [Pyronema omphalodes]|nr:hypothetical protein BZA77DRAFT_354016 [Pyronema omphalodes]
MPLPPHREDSGYQSSTSTSCTADVTRRLAQKPDEFVKSIEDPEQENEDEDEDEDFTLEDEPVEYLTLLVGIWSATCIAWLMGKADTIAALTIGHVFTGLVLILKLSDMRYEELENDLLHHEKLKEFYMWCEDLANTLWHPVWLILAWAVIMIKNANDRFERGLQELFGDLFIAG